MNFFIIISGIVILASVSVIYLILRSDAFVRAFCLRLFQERQQKFLKEFNNSSRIDEINSKDEVVVKMTESLQDLLWSKSKQMDENISQRIFVLETILDIAYIAWLIYFINKNHDVSKS